MAVAAMAQDHKLSSLVMHRGTSADVWTELSAWIETVMPDQPLEGVGRAQLAQYLPANDTLLLKQRGAAAPRGRARQVRGIGESFV